MFKHILVATDGSKLSGKAIRTAVKLAKVTGAKITGAYVIAPFVPPAYGEGMVYVPAVSPTEYRRIAERAARKALATVEIAARSAGTRHGSAVLTADSPWKGILRAAKAKKCDLIVMSSHGRRGLVGLLLGSKTTEVLTHSRIPVLVCR
jgi:nucleotide-binding universal stress UspA family protein